MQSWGRWVYNARYYDPILSRFISADSVSGGNRYTYVSNNPISNSDPSGNVMTAGDGGGGGGGAPQEGGQKSPFGQIPAYTYTPSINTAQVGNTGVINGIWGGSSAYSTQGQTWTSEAAGYNCPPGKDCGHDALPISTLVGGFGLGFPCALGFLPSCVMTNALLASAWGQQIASNGQSNSLTAPALVASSVAIGGQMAIQGGQAVGGAIKNYKASLGPDIEQYVPGSRADYLNVPNNISEGALADAPPGYVTKVYGDFWGKNRIGYSSPPSYEPYDFQKEVLKRVAVGDYRGAWDCIARTCASQGFQLGYDANMALNGVYDNGAITLNPNRPLDQLVRTFGHECGHGCDLMSGYVKDVLASEARQWYFNSAYYAAQGDMSMRNYAYDNAVRFGTGRYPGQ